MLELSTRFLQGFVAISSELLVRLLGENYRPRSLGENTIVSEMIT